MEAANPVDSLASIAASISTPSTKRRIQIFSNEIPFVLTSMSSDSEMTTDFASLLVEIIFRTLLIYDDGGSRKAVDNLIVKVLREVAFMKNFAATLVQVMEKHLKLQSHVVCYRLIKWSCLLLTESQFTLVSKNALCRVAQVQASVLHLAMQGSFRVKKACKQSLLHLFSKSPDIYKTYMEELKNSRISYKDCPEFVSVVLEHASSNLVLFDQWRQTFLDMYVNAILNAKEKPVKGLSEAFLPLFSNLSHDDFRSVVVPASVKMLKRNPELVLESVGVLLQYTKLDLSKYVIEILEVDLTQARHSDEGRRLAALTIVRCLSQKSSSPDAVDAMFTAVKSVIGGSEGRLTFPYQRVGMINALQELSNAPEGKYLNSLSPTICGFLLSCYKDDGNEEVKLACLSSLASWAARSAAAIQQDLVSFISSGLKEKETLRRGYLRCLRVMCKNTDAVIQMSSLLVPLLQLVKTGFTKAAQRLDGIYALLCVARIVAVDVKADEMVAKEKIWTLISQSEPSLMPISLASKLSLEDCMACLDLFEVLLVDHSHRVLENFPVSALLQFLLFSMCHPNWDFRGAAYDSMKKILAAVPQLSDAILLEFSNYLSVVREKVLHLKMSDTENVLDAQVPFIPPVELLVKALVVIASAVLSASPCISVDLLCCSHNPFLVGTSKKDAVWKRLQNFLQMRGFDVIGLVTANVVDLCKGLLGPRGLMSPNHLQQDAAMNSLSTLMSIIPGHTYAEFEKYLKNLPDLCVHDTLTEKDIQIFRTPEGMLSTEQGVYLAESVASKNIKQAKGRFRLYETNDNLDEVKSNHSARRESSNKDVAGVGKKDIGKSMKKPDKVKTAKEEARDLQLREEASVRERAMVIQNNLSSMLRAMGEMAIANPIFAHSQLPSMSAGMQAIDEIVPTLLHALEDDQTSDTALDGLKQILSVRTTAVLPHILPKLVHLPLTAFNAHALGALADVAGPGLDFHLSTILPALLVAMGDADEDVRNLAKKAAETVVLVIDEEGIESLISELLKGVGDNQASVRQSSSYLVGYLFKNSKLYLVDEAPNMISTLIILLSDTDSQTVALAWEALSRVISSIPKEILPSYIKLVRDAVSTSRDKERRKKKGSPVVIPGLCLPKALQPLLPVFLQGLIGSAELREQAALGLGELIEVTSEQALKEFVIPITGPLIRIIGDRFPWQVKSAILSTLSIILRKGGMALKPFLPQLQTTFIKCLQDNTRTVRSSAALALGKLSALSTRVDPLVGDLLSGLQASDVGVREAILTALKGVVRHAGQSVGNAVRTRICTILKDLIYSEDDQIRSLSASIFGIISQYLEDDQISEVLKELPTSASSPSWLTRHGSVLTISAMLGHNPAVVFASPSFAMVVNCLRSNLKDEKFPVRETSMSALGKLLLHQIQCDPSNSTAHLETLSSIVLAMHDDSSEVRRRALSSLKAVAKVNPTALMIHAAVFGPVLAECLKDGSTPVRLAAERCALHTLQLAKGGENVQAAQKFITGLDARRISKLPEYSDDSDNSEDDMAIGS